MMTVPRVLCLVALAGPLMSPAPRRAFAQVVVDTSATTARITIVSRLASADSQAAHLRHLADPDKKLVMDPALVQGALPNGVRYFIRANTQPAQRAELRLVVNAGSVFEDDSQRGVAHFVEHMAFRGTKNYPGMSMVDYLESVGVRIKSDLNASTSYDETVYRLTVPTNDSGHVVEKGIHILREWASEVTFDSAEVVAERDVILAELKSRRGVEMRMLSGRDSLLFAGTRYAARLPIGTELDIKTATPAALKRFYADWYRPELISVIVVGDIDPVRVEALIRQQFGEIPKSRFSRVVPSIPFRPHGSLVSLMHDSLQSAWQAQLYFPKVGGPPVTRGQYRDYLADGLLGMILSRRLALLSSNPTAPVVSAHFGMVSPRRAVPMYLLSIETRKNRYIQGVTAALAELERIAQHGVDSAEMSEATIQMIAAVEEGALGQETRRSTDLADEYVQIALQPSLVSMNGKTAAELIRNMAPTVTGDDLRTLAQTIRRARGPLFVGMTPVPEEPITDSMVESSIREVDAMALSPNGPRRVIPNLCSLLEPLLQAARDIVPRL